VLHIDVVRQIGRLLDEGQLSQRGIAAALGVSRGVVGQIAAGTRGLHGRGETVSLAKPATGEALAARCPGCGGKVYMPCRLCRTRAFTQRVA